MRYQSPKEPRPTSADADTARPHVSRSELRRKAAQKWRPLGDKPAGVESEKTSRLNEHPFSSGSRQSFDAAALARHTFEAQLGTASKERLDASFLTEIVGKVFAPKPETGGLDNVVAVDSWDDSIPQATAKELEREQAEGADVEEELSKLSATFGEHFTRPWDRAFEVVLQHGGRGGVRKKPYRLRATLPIGYPVEPPLLELCGDAPAEIIAAIQQLPASRGWSSGCFGLVEAAKEVVAQLTVATGVPSSGASHPCGSGSGMVQLVRAFFSFSNAPSKLSGAFSAYDVEVICNMVKQHPAMGGVISQGKPGILILEGPRNDVEEIVTEVKRYHSKTRRGRAEMVERLIERKAVRVDQCSDWRAFGEAAFQVIDAEFNKPRAKQGWLNKDSLKDELDARGLGDKLNILFGV